MYVCFDFMEKIVKQIEFALSWTYSVFTYFKPNQGGNITCLRAEEEDREGGEQGKKGHPALSANGNSEGSSKLLCPTKTLSTSLAYMYVCIKGKNLDMPASRRFVLHGKLFEHHNLHKNTTSKC